MSDADLDCIFTLTALYMIAKDFAIIPLEDLVDWQFMGPIPATLAVFFQICYISKDNKDLCSKMIILLQSRTMTWLSENMHAGTKNILFGYTVQSSLVERTGSVALYLSLLRQFLPKPEGFACILPSGSLIRFSFMMDCLLKSCRLTREDCNSIRIKWLPAVLCRLEHSEGWKTILEWIELLWTRSSLPLPMLIVWKKQNLNYNERPP